MISAIFCLSLCALADNLLSCFLLRKRLHMRHTKKILKNRSLICVHHKEDKRCTAIQVITYAIHLIYKIQLERKPNPEDEEVGLALVRTEKLSWMENADIAKIKAGL